jgi:hypothetical protein
MSGPSAATRERMRHAIDELRRPSSWRILHRSTFSTLSTHCGHYEHLQRGYQFSVLSWGRFPPNAPPQQRVHIW